MHMKKKTIDFVGRKKAWWKRLSKRRKALYGVVALAVVVLVFTIFFKNKGVGGEMIVVVPQEISKTVQVSGELTSNTNLSLGFEQAGVIKSTPVAVGTKVKIGSILATLSAGSEQASVTRAKGGLLKAEAEYNKAIQITGGEEIVNKELELTNTKRQQDLLVANARKALLSNDLQAFPSGNDNVSAPTISGSYTCDSEGVYYLQLYASSASSGSSYNVTGLENDVGSVYTVSTDNIGQCGLYIGFDEGFSTTTDWEIPIPNKRSSTYLTYKNAYDLAVDTREKTISQLESDIALLKLKVETSDTKIAYANLVSAQGDYAAAVAVFEDTIIRAPASGVLTKISKKPGESVGMREEVVVLQDINNLYVTADVNESNIVGIKPGQQVAVTFDALSEEQIFSGTVSDIDIAPTNTGNVTNYTITAVIDALDPILRPGMTANMTVKLFANEQVIAIPRRALIAKDEGWYVTILDEKENKQEVAVVLGRDADGGLVEIVSGLTETMRLWIEPQE